jgi:hypothetical protein
MRKKQLINALATEKAIGEIYKDERDMYWEKMHHYKQDLADLRLRRDEQDEEIARLKNKVKATEEEILLRIIARLLG